MIRWVTYWAGHELVISGLLVAACTVPYVIAGQNELPRPSGFVGLGLGILGFVFMIATEILYTLRKRIRGFVLGRTQMWLKFHIVTGIVGPYLVLLHTAGKYNGLAGVAMLLTGLMVVSGFVGRYLYTAAPRGLDGSELDIAQLQQQLKDANERLQTLSSEARQALEEPPPEVRPWLVVVLRHWWRWRYRQRLVRAVRKLAPEEREVAKPLISAFTARYRLVLQMHSLTATRQLLALWHALHVPFGGVLFVLAFLHVGAASYYAVFMK